MAERKMQAGSTAGSDQVLVWGRSSRSIGSRCPPWVGKRHQDKRRQPLLRSSG
jgi:hypothetical protein